MRGIKLKKFLIIAVIATLMITSACSKESSNNASNSKQIELTFMNNWGIEAADFIIYQDRIKQFEKENPNIKIIQDKVPAADYMTKLRTLSTGRKLPDLAVVWPGAELEPLVEGEVIQPIDGIISNWESIIDDEYLKGYEIDGKNYAVPTKINSMSIIYYNKELLEKAGYKEFPSNYSEFLNLIKKLREDGITPMSVGNKPKWPLQSSYISTIADRITGSDFLQEVLEGKKKFTDKEFVRSLEVIEELVKLEAFNKDINSIDEVQNQDNFLQGKSAMIMTSSSANARLRIDNENRENVGVSLFPAIDGGKGDPSKSPTVIQYGVAMNKQLGGVEKKAAEKFLKFFYNEDLYKSLAESGIAVPSKIELSNNENQQTKTELFKLMEKGATPVYDSVISPQAKAALENGLQAITVGQKTPKQVAKDMQDIIEKEN